MSRYSLIYTLLIVFVSICFGSNNQYMVVKGLIITCRRNYPVLQCQQMNIIEGELTMEMFANNVTSYLNDGWIVAGGISIDRPYVYQALIKNS
jgi:hypothetical protein